MTISFAGTKVGSNADYDCMKNAKTGDTFLATDNDGEEWVILVDEKERYVVLASSETNYFPGSVFSCWDDMLECLVDYKATIRQVDFELRVDD